MAMFLDAFMSKFSTLLTDFVEQEVSMLLGVKDELQKLRHRMRSIQNLLNDAEKRKFDDSSLEDWLSQLKDVMYDAEDVIDLCRIEGAQLLDDQNLESKTSPVCCNFSSSFSCFTGVPLRHEIGNKIKEINERLNQIYENRKKYKLEKSTISKTPKITLVDSRKTSSMVDPFVVGREVEDAANRLVDRLVGEKVDEKCRIFAVVGMGGIGKTTLAQKIFNHSKNKTYFNLPVWVCVSQTYSEIDLLKHIIRETKGSYGDANTKSELQPILSASIASCQSFFLVLDDVWRADVWIDLLRVPIYNAKTIVRVLVTTRDKKVAKEMGAAHIHQVDRLSKERSWDILRIRLFSEEEEELANGLRELGFMIVEKCGFLPLAIKVVAGVLAGKERTRKVWNNFLKNDAWSINNLPEDLKGAIYLSFEDLPSHLKQCFLYFSLYHEDANLSLYEFTKLWIAEGFITEQKESLMEDLAEECYIELVNRNLLLPSSGFVGVSKMHDLIRCLAIDLSKGEASCGDSCVRNSTTSTKLRRLLISNKKGAIEILNSIVEQEALRTLIASRSDLLLDDHRFRRLLHLRVLDISFTSIEVLPDSIGNLVHLRYLNLIFTKIREISESIKKLINLQFLDMLCCKNLTQVPSGFTLLHNLRYLDLTATPITSIPKGVEKMQQLNYLRGFVATNNDSDSKLVELNSLKQIRTLGIFKLERAHSEEIILKDLPHLSNLELHFRDDILNSSEEQELAVEELFDKIIPPQSLENLKICNFFGRRFPNWMTSSFFEVYVPYLTKLELSNIRSCTQLPPLGQLPALRELEIYDANKVKKIGPEFLGGGVNSTTKIAFPKLQKLVIGKLYELEEWSFGAQVEENASPRLKLLPCLQKLHIKECLLLKQLPEGLKHSSMKLLHIYCARSLESVENLPTEIKELEVMYCNNLKNIHCPPTLKFLYVIGCEALSCVENLDSLQKIIFENYKVESLPEWLLEFLQQRVLQNYTKDDDFLLKLHCNGVLYQKCKEGGSYWNLIQHIPQVKITPLNV